MRWLREPLVHFLALGVGLFLLHAAVAAPVKEDAVIDLTAGEIEQAVQIFEKTFQRPPNAVELEGLIEDRIREEIFYREALAMGLDKGDTAVRRRLRQKVEFLFNDLAGLAEPKDAELADYLAAHADEYLSPTRVSFRQIYLNRSQRGAAALDEAERLLAMLNGAEDVDVAGLGDFLVLPRSYELIPENEVAKHFGPGFAGRLAEVPTGRWAGPVASGYGLHLVQVSERVEGELPELAEIRQLVKRDWSADRRAEATTAFYQGLRKRYTVNVERPEPAAPEVAEVSR